MDPLRSSDPRHIDGIELHGTLGEGGMGTVYFGVTPEGDQVAVKVIRKDLAGQDEIRERFEREVLAMGMVQGPRVAGLVAAAEPGAERPWLAMEYVRGVTLKEYVEANGPLSTEMGAVLGDLLAEALTEIHRTGLLHRDLKPANILLGADGPKVIDFGLVDLVESDQGLTQTNAVLGTPAFMSPQHAGSPRDLTPAADVYSLGVVLIYALTKHLAYKAAGHGAMLMAILDQNQRPDLSGLPPVLEPVIGAMVAYEPEGRPSLGQASKEFRAALIAGGLAPRDARVHFATLTYVERASDPPTYVEPPKVPVQRRPRERTAPRPAVETLADRLFAAYGPSARL